MPRGRTKKDAPEFDKILSALENLNERITGLEDAKNTPVVPAPEVIKPIESPIEAPVPEEYKECVAQLLNRHFEIRIYPRADAPLFELVVVVPKKYSSCTPEYLQLYHEDRRVKVLSYADGLPGVEQYVRLVAKTFNDDITSQIMADKITDGIAVNS